MKKILGSLAAGALMLSAPPAFAQSRAEHQLMADVRMLQEQAQQLAIAVAALNVTLNDSLKAINGRIDQQTEVSRKAFADQKLVMDNVSADMRVIRERTDDTTVRIATLGQELEALRSSMPVAPAPVATATEPVDANAPPGTTPPPAPAVPSTAGLSPTRMYETSFADYTAGQYSLAITGFETFLKAFPKSEMADEAQFYIGETHYVTGRYQDAVAAYNHVIQNYPGSNSVLEAYYKRGLAQERLGEADAARASWEFLVKNHPESDPGRLAKQNLDRLGRKPGGQ
jgi:tol-pal system protein YbgF